MIVKSTKTTMGILADRLAEIIEEMKESDRRTDALIREHISRTRELLDELAETNGMEAV